MILLERIWKCVILSFTPFTPLSCKLTEDQNDYEESLLQKCEETNLDVSSYNDKSSYEPPFVINELI